ncbi:TIGR00288 family NYN domain-containing protein [Methanimicrococcus blatticola]|uniref:Uncharacterized protein (TIGR00288 family) n=1 Tax=Methanimicrococcus blatticola TaxID=91560 RepID=A0A484F2R8_9EURY|nr:TIGR00288 family NYN domain-containing protein [Methanimicrococcus blatticola]MBZ3935416.1 TIGR00288 family NYN domain-containing protein [Methanimicrococcus blatticola]TDQ67794.1 uncharacterized protein (TIGR00288 family) [Methanimicrococcus blatticola]
MSNPKSGFGSITKYLSSKKENERKRIGLLVDGPNVIRKEFNVDLYEIKNALKEYGNVKIGKVFINQYASNKLIEAIENHGLEPIICSSDVDVRLAVEGMELVYNDNIDTIAIVTRDADFKPLLNKANEKGKETIIFGIQPGFSIALKNSADYVILLKDAKMAYEDDDGEVHLLAVEDEEEPEEIEISKKDHEDYKVEQSQRRFEVIKSKDDNIGLEDA